MTKFFVSNMDEYSKKFLNVIASLENLHAVFDFDGVLTYPKFEIGDNGSVLSTHFQ